jgi:hypothetical protein
MMNFLLHLPKGMNKVEVSMVLIDQALEINTPAVAEEVILAQIVAGQQALHNTQLSQGILKAKRQHRRKSAAATGSHPPIEKSGKTPHSQSVIIFDCQDQAAFAAFEKSGKTSHSQSVLVSDCQDQLKKAEGPTDFGLIFHHGNLKNTDFGFSFHHGNLKNSEGKTEFGFTFHHDNPDRMTSMSLSKPCSKHVWYSCRMKPFELFGSYSPVDRGVKGGKCRSEDTHLISIKHMQNCSIDGCAELNAGKVPIGTYGAVTLTHEGHPVIIKQEENTTQSPAELEDFGSIVSNVLMKPDTHQGNINLCGFTIPIWQKNDLKKIPMYLLTDQAWKELSHVILSRDQPWDASEQDREVNMDHIAHRTKVMNGRTHIALSVRRFDDEGQDQHRNKYAMQNRTTLHQVTCHYVRRQDIDSLMQTMDLPNISLTGNRERAVSSHDAIYYGLLSSTPASTQSYSWLRASWEGSSTTISTPQTVQRSVSSGQQMLLFPTRYINCVEHTHCALLAVVRNGIHNATVQVHACDSIIQAAKGRILAMGSGSPHQQRAWYLMHCQNSGGTEIFWARPRKSGTFSLESFQLFNPT